MTVSGDEISGTTSCHTTSEMRRVAAGRAPVTAAARGCFWRAPLIARRQSGCPLVWQISVSRFPKWARPLPPRPGGVAAGVAMGDLGAKARFQAQTGADAEPSGFSAPRVRRGPRDGARFEIHHLSQRRLTRHPPRRDASPLPSPRRPTPAGRTRGCRVPHPARPRAVPGGPTSTCTSSRAPALVQNREKVFQAEPRAAAARRDADAAREFAENAEFFKNTEALAAKDRASTRYKRELAFMYQKLPGFDAALEGKSRKAEAAARDAEARGARSRARRRGLPPLSAEEIARCKKRKMRGTRTEERCAADAFPSPGRSRAPARRRRRRRRRRRPASRRADSATQCLRCGGFGHASGARVPHARAQPERCVPRENRGPAGAGARARRSRRRASSSSRARRTPGAPHAGPAWTRRRRPAARGRRVRRRARRRGQSDDERAVPTAGVLSPAGRTATARARAFSRSLAGGKAPTDSEFRPRRRRLVARGCRGRRFCVVRCCVRGDARHRKAKREKREKKDKVKRRRRDQARGKNPSSPRLAQRLIY